MGCSKLAGHSAYWKSIILDNFVGMLLVPGEPYPLVTIPPAPAPAPPVVNLSGIRRSIMRTCNNLIGNRKLQGFLQIPQSRIS